MDEFQAILIEGHFTYEMGGLVCHAAQGRVLVDEVLSPFEGKRVRIAAHHLPPMPPDPTRWAGGACRWQDQGLCPAGHHARPTWLYNESVEGVLERAGLGDWVVVAFNGTRTNLPLAQLLVGHSARIAAATVVSVEKMRESLEAKGMQGTVEGMTERVADLRELLGRLRGRPGEGK